MTFRCKVILDAARDAPACMLCNGHNDGTIVAAHSNQLRDGKAKSLKAADYRVAYLCHVCHSEIDQGAHMSRAERIEAWEEAHRRTIGWLFESGKVVAK